MGLPTPESRPEGFVFTNDVNKFWGLSTLTSVIVIGVVVIFLCVAIAIFLDQPSIGSSFFLICMAFSQICIVVGIIQWFIVWLRLKPGILVIPSYPLRLGESFPIRYSRYLRNGQTPNAGTISGTWRCYEWVQYTRGTETRTLTETIWKTELPSISIEQGVRAIHYEMQLAIGPNLPPSFEAKHNRVRWELQLKLDFPRLVKENTTFLVHVEPEVLE